MGKKIGILTGGGDAPGLNQVIRGIVFRGTKNYDFEFFAIRDGWKGLINGLFSPLTLGEVHKWSAEGGSLIGSSRTNPFKKEGGPQKCKENFDKAGFHAIIALGGEDTLGVAYRIWNEIKIPCIGVPKTIDNDLPGTDQCFGFDTAINRVMESIDRLRTTARSHHRILVVEVMGRNAGWMTLVGGIAGGADVIIIPEKPFNLEDIAERLKKVRAAGQEYAIVAVSEGARMEYKEGSDMVTQDAELDEFGHVRLGGIGKFVADQLEKLAGWEARHVVLGHLQRGGEPSAFDRWLSTRLGIAAADLVAGDKFGKMIALKGFDIITIGLEEAAKGIRTVPNELAEIARIMES